MIALYLIASHMVGDYMFQNRWHAARKFTNRWERALHVAWYGCAFTPVVAFYAPSQLDGIAFVVLLVVLHFITDSRRYLSNLGDVLGWRFRQEFRRPGAKQREWRNQYKGNLPLGTRYDRTPPNPWPGLPLMIDQTYHLVQIAVLAGLFLT